MSKCENFDQILKALKNATTPVEVISILESLCLSTDETIVSYHCLPPTGADITDPVSLVCCPTFSNVTVKKYMKNMTYRHNPFVVRPLLLARSLLWSEIHSLSDLSCGETQVAQDLRTRFPGEGVCIPTYGPLRHNGSFAISLGKEGETSSQLKLLRLQMYFQQGHIRICELLEQRRSARIKFTEREKDVLEWLAQGKSNSVIADILGISSATVSNYLANIFLKLNTRDRVSTALRANAIGAIF